MRKVKVEIKCRVPSWNFCTLDDFTANGRFSKEVCKYCVKDKHGYHCVLHDAGLAVEKDFVLKCPSCIKVTAGFPLDEEPTMPPVDPKVIIRETLKNYKQTVKQLMDQGYPASLAETLATKYVLGEK